MKAFSFSSILKNFGKQLSSLASQMPWCNLRFNLGSMSVLSRVSRPFSRRVWKYVAMIVVVLVLSMANIGMAWGASPLTVETPDAPYYTQDGVTVFGENTTGKMKNSSSQKCYNTNNASVIVFSELTNITGISFDMCLAGDGSGEGNAISLYTSTGDVFAVPSSGFTATKGGSALESLTNIQAIKANQSSLTSISVTFDSPVKGIELKKAASTNIRNIVVTYNNTTLPSVYFKATTTSTADSANVETTPSGGSMTVDTKTTKKTINSIDYYQAESGSQTINLGTGNTFQAGDQIVLEFCGSGNNKTVGPIIQKTTNCTISVTVNDKVPAKVAYIVSEGDGIQGQTSATIIRTSSDLYIRSFSVLRAAPPCTEPNLSYATTAVTKTVGDEPFTNALTNTNSVEVAYSSTNASVATVNSSTGEVTIVGAGTTTIKATWEGNATYCADEASYTLTVNKANISPTLTYSNTSLDIDGTANPTINGNTGNGAVTYSSSNTDVATVDENTGMVTAVGAGTATITATIAATANYNGGTATATITVNAAQEPETYSITYECDGATSGCPSNATEQTALPNPLPSAPTKTGYTFDGWYTDAEKTIQAVAGATLTADITLYAKWTQMIVSVESVEVSPSSKTIEVDATQQLTATISPDNATNKNVTWSSSNESVATVDEHGLVTAVAAGTATITATTEDGNKTDQCTITVEKIQPEKYNFSIDKTELCGDEKATLTLVNSQSNVTYELREDSDTSIAETEKQGTGSALTWNVGAGTYVVYAKETDKYSERQMDGSKITISNGTATSITTQPTNQEVTVGEEATLTVVAAGTSLSYQWKESATEDGEYSNVSTGSGKTSASYSVTPAAAGTKWYKCVVTGTCGEVTTEARKIVANAAVTYTVTYDAQGGTCKASDTGSSITLPTPTKDDYTFQGWYTSGGELVSSPYSPTADITLHALWREDECSGGGGGSSTVYSMYLSGTNGKSDVTITQSTADVASISNVLDDSSPMDVGGLKYFKFGSSSSITLNYTFVAGDKLVFDLCSKDDNKNCGVSVKVGSADAVAVTGTINQTPSTLEYTMSSAGSQTIVIKRAGDDGSAMRLHGISITRAGGSGTCYYVTYNGNGADGDFTTDEASHPSGSNVTVASNSFTKTGYRFTGWKTEPSGGTSYAAGGTISGISGNMTLYAQWEEDKAEPTTYTLTNVVNTDGYGTVSPASVSEIPSGTTTSSSSNTYTVNGTTVTATPAESTAQYTYAFSSWSGLPATVTENATVTANFTRTVNTYTVTWKNADGTTLETDNNVEYGTTPTYNGATPTKAADAENTYAFEAWSPAISAVTGDATYTATFTATPIEIPEPTTLTALECGTLYKVEDMVPSGVTLSGTGQYAAGSSENGKFEVIGDAEKTENADGTPEMKTGNAVELDDESFTGQMWLKGAANLTDNIPTSRAIKFILSQKGTLTIYYRDNNTGASELKLIEENSPSTAKWISQTKGDAFGTTSELEAGTYYIYATAGSTAIYGIQLNCSCTNPTITFSNGSYTVGGSALDLSTLFTSNSAGEVTYTITNNANETGASISSTSFTATAAGTATVKATQAANGNYCSGEATATITVNAAPIIPDPEDLYTVTFDTNGGSEVSPITQASAGAPITLPTPTKDGYELVGWYIGGGLVTDDTYTPTADITATAAWKENCILGTGGEDNTTHSTTFVGSSSATGNWSGNSNLGSTQFADNTTNCLKLKTNGTLTYTFPDVVTLKSVQLKMAFANDQEDLPWSLTVKDASDTQLIKKDVITNMIESKVPENFDISLEYNNVKKVTLTNDSEKDLLVGSITFTIVISSGSGECYYVTYNGNGADGGSVNDANAYAANEEVTTLANGFTRAGYTFTGWNTAADGTGTPYAAGGTFNITENTELFAQWKENTDVELGDCTATTITYNLVTPNKTTPSQTVSPTGVITELTGADAIGTATTNTGSINNSFADYSVRYGASEGSDNAENGVIFTFTVPTGYVFKPSAITTNLMCYGRGKNGDTQNYEFYGSLSDGATTINGTALPGTAEGANADIVYSNIANKTLSGTVTLRLNAVKVGGSNQSFRIKSPITIEGELCSAQTYTITYNKNGGSGDMESTNNVVAENEFTREGYTFDGWNTKTDGTGTSYAAGEIVASNLTLYAQWKCIEPEFTVSYSQTEYTINDEASEITVTVTAGNSGGVTYQWYSSTTNDRNNGNTIGGATSASYTPSTTSVGTTYYWCEIENTCTSVQTAMIAITVRADKNTPSVTWTNPSDVNYGGGNYSISATVNGEWDGTLTADMLTAPTGINLYNVLVQDKTISATFDVTTSFDRVANPTTIPFYLSLPETDDYYSLVSEGDVPYEACTTGGGSEYRIPVNENSVSSTNPNYRWDTENVGWITWDQGGGTIKSESVEYNDFSYRTSSGKQIILIYSKIPQVKRIRIYGYGSNATECTAVSVGTEYNIYQKLSVEEYAFTNDVKSITNRENGVIEISFTTPLAENTYVQFSFSSNAKFYGVELETDGGGTLQPTLQWSNSLANEATVEKNQSDVNFTYTASLTGENSNTLGTITYSSSNTSVATVNPTTGEVSIIAAGTTTIIATLAPSGCYQGATATYELTVTEQICAIAAGTLSASKTDKYDCEEVTLTLSNYEQGATIEWWHNGEAIDSKLGITINGNILTTTLEGTYSALVTKDCNVRSNSVTITNIASASATPLVSEWYVKNGRLTPPIALWKLEGGARIAGVGWTKGEEPSTAPYDNPENVIDVENGIVYLTGTPPQANNTEEDIRYTIQLSIMNSCDDSPMVVPSTITIIHQKNTDKHVLAFVVTGKEKGGFIEGITDAQTTSVPLYNTISHNFEVLATNIYATDNEQLLKEYYSQFDIICITDYPNTKTKGVNGKSYTDAMGSLIDIRPILSMEAWVSNYTNWNNKGVTGDPKSPTTRQYSMLLQCKDHEIFAGTSLVSEDVDGETMYRVTMVDATKADYVTLDKETAGTDSYDHDGKPALQGFTYTSAMSSMLPIGIIDDGDGNNLQVGLERQHEIEARMMVIGVNSYAMERLTADGETVIINALNYLMKKNAEDISDCSIYFDNNGGTGDGLWSSPVNWGPSRNSLPQSSQEARILAPCVVSDYTAKVASVKIVTDGTYKYQSMDGEANGSLTIAPNGALVVKGRIQAATAPNYLETRNTDVKDLIVQSDATGNGALIHGEIGEAIGATVELLSKAYSVREFNESTGKYKKKKYWQYVALPVQNALAEDAFWGAYTYQYDETQGWIKKGTGENIEEFWGIGLSIDNEVYSGANNETSLTKFTIKGNLALATDRDIDLTRTTNAGEGQNMIGNSWTAPIHLTSMTEDDFENAVATVYIYNTGRDEQVPGSEGIASSANGSTQAGQWISIPVAATKLESWQGPKVIPSMQAFEVDLDEGKTSGVLHLNYDKHVRTIATPEEENLPLRAPKYLGNEPLMIRLRVADSITYTDLYLIEGDQFTDEFDNAWDGKYQPCDGRSATLYAMSPIGDMAVLAQPSVNNTSVVFEPGKKSEYVFTFGYNGDVTYYLNDMQLKTSTEIKEGNEYRFTYNKGDMKNRFLVTQESFDSPNISTGLANIVTDGNGLQVTNPNQENLQVILIDAAGRMCSIYNTAEPMFKVELPATQGVYMINVKGETTNIVRKVVK